jgi:hypothetical protein
MVSVIRDVSKTYGKNRYKAKAFKTEDSMYKFLQTDDNALFWHRTATPLKSGLYFSRIEKFDDKNAIVYYSVKLLNS